MLRSMNSAISGLKNHQVFMDVIGNNISNVNTTGFKASRVTFQTALSQTLRGSVSPAVGRGGINNVQIGLGSGIASVDMVNSQGTMFTTGKLTDMAIQGDGFFVVTDGVRKYYSRDGAFDIGADGSLLSPATGLRVMGWNASTDVFGNTVVNNAFPPTAPITLPIGQAVTAQKSSIITLNGNLNGAPTNLLGSGAVESSTVDTALGFAIAGTETVTFTYNGQTFTTAALTAAATNTAGTLVTVAADLQTKMNNALVTGGVIAAAASGITVAAVDDSGTTTSEGVFTFSSPKALKFGNSASSNTDLNVALRTRSAKGLETMTSSMIVYDSEGNGHEMNLKFDKVTSDSTGVLDANVWRWSIVNLDPGTTIDGLTGTGNGAGTGYLKFDTSGKFTSVNTVSGGYDPVTSTVADKPSSASVRFDFTGGAADDQDVILDFSILTQLQDGNTAAAALNDGFATGTLLSFVVGQDGMITGSYTNGVTKVLAQIAMATFPNIGGMTAVSQNLFTESANSGIPNIGAPNSSSRGQVNAGQLEVSNVDLAVQFTDMIRAERGFQANSRVVTTSDEMLQDLVNMKR